MLGVVIVGATPSICLSCSCRLRTAASEDVIFVGRDDSVPDFGGPIGFKLT